MHLLRLSFAIPLVVVTYGQTPDVATLENSRLTLAFDTATGGLVDVSIPDSDGDFILELPPAPLLWELQFRSAQGEDLQINNSQVPPPQIVPDSASLTLEWNDLALGNETACVDIKVTCQLPSDNDTALLRIWIDNRSTIYGLWDISFPVIRGVGKTGATDVAMPHDNWGKLYQGPTDRIEGEYPHHSLPMQFILLQNNNRGLYLAAQDSEARYKTFAIQVGEEFRVTTRANDMGVAGNDWMAPYPFAVGVYRGSWINGCKKYRAWVTQNAPWTAKGSLHTRSDVPDTIKNVCAWLRAGGSSDHVLPQVNQFADAIGAPVGVHWYDWHEIPFDTFYPNYFPTKPGFPEAVQQLVSSGVTVMPYINGRLWDTANENFEVARPASVKDENGEVTTEVYGSGAKLAVMCPTQPLWQDKIEGIIHRLGQECGVNAVYLDQIATARPRMCFDVGHKHTLGSGAWWVDGYRTLLTPIKQWATTQGRSIGLTTECTAEPYMDTMDAHLIFTPRSDDEIPMMTAVYSGYTLYFGSNQAFGHGVPSYCLCQARDFVWGAQLGWERPAILAPYHKEKLQFLSRLAKLRAKALDYFVYGELVEVLDPGDGVPVLSGTWNTWDKLGKGPVSLPAVHAARWVAEDGSNAVIIANADTASHEFSFPLPKSGGELKSPEAWKIERVTVKKNKRLPAPAENASTYTVEVPARDGVIVLFRMENA